MNTMILPAMGISEASVSTLTLSVLIVVIWNTFEAAQTFIFIVGMSVYIYVY